MVFNVILVAFIVLVGFLIFKLISNKFTVKFQMITTVVVVLKTNSTLVSRNKMSYNMSFFIK